MLDNFGLLLVDDHPLFRDGLMAALRHHAPGLRTQSVATLDGALSMLAATEDAIDLVLVDYMMPGTNGLHCAAVLKRQYPGVGVGLISGLSDPSLPGRARAAGLCAYLPKSLELSVLMRHLQQLARGEPVFCIPGRLAADPDTPPARDVNLTTRQRQVLHLLAGGSSNKEIARALDIAPATVKKHLEAIYARMGAANRMQAAIMARALSGDPPAS